MSANRPYLSFVVAARNDNHGGNQLKRIQLFVNSLFEQIRAHNLSAELILVEWNPVQNKRRLYQAITWPKGQRVRVIEVPPHIHRRFRHSDRLPLFQMIAKNVGIRRARGEFILATNVDLLFSGALVKFLASGTLNPKLMYRIDRYDVPSNIPTTLSVEDQLKFCDHNVLRINMKDGTFTPSSIRWHKLRMIRRIAKEFLDCLILIPPRVSLRKRKLGLRRLISSARIKFTRLGRKLTRSARIKFTRLGRKLTRSARIKFARLGPRLERILARKKAVFRRGLRSARFRLLKQMPALGAAVLFPIFLYATGIWLADSVMGVGGWLRDLVRHLWESSKRMVRHLWESSKRMVRHLVGSLERQARSTGERLSAYLASRRALLTKAVELLWKRIHPLYPRLHTNACGDFTLLARKNWYALRGYPELEMFSFHLDSVLCHMAYQSGLGERVLGGKMRLYHIEHSSGWTMRSDRKMHRRWNRLGVPVLTFSQFENWASKMQTKKRPLAFNGKGWGLAGEEIPEIEIN